MTGRDISNACFLTVREIAELLAVHPNTVRQYIAAGDLKAVRARPGAAIRVTREAFDAFVGVTDDNVVVPMLGRSS